MRLVLMLVLLVMIHFDGLFVVWSAAETKRRYTEKESWISVIGSAAETCAYAFLWALFFMTTLYV